MTAYVIVEIEVIDAAAYEAYRSRVNAVNAKYGGRFIARGGEVQTLEGDWSPKRVVIVEFPGMAQALAWYRSADYAQLIELRKSSARFRMIVVQGLP